MMKTLAGFILTDFCVFPLSAGTKTISRIILVSVCAALLFSPSLCVFFFFVALDLCSVFFLCYLLSFICSLRPVSPHGSAHFPLPRSFPRLFFLLWFFCVPRFCSSFSLVFLSCSPPFFFPAVPL